MTTRLTGSCCMTPTLYSIGRGMLRCRNCQQIQHVSVPSRYR